MELQMDRYAAQQNPVDFDHHSADHAANWPSAFAELRANNPRPWSERHGGFWIATKFKDIVSIGQRPDFFSAHKDYDPVTGAIAGGISIPAIPGLRGVPNETASPEWDGVRTFINRRFSPRAVEAFRLKAQQFAAALIDDVIETGRFDIVEDFTNPMPALVTMELFGFPLDEWRAFADPFHKIIYTPRDDPEFPNTVRGLDYFRQRVEEVAALRRIEPRDDLLSHFANGSIDGKPLDGETLYNLAFNILAGGVDTTTALTSNTLIHLSRHPEDRERLRSDRALMPLAREEFVRFFSPIHALARNVVEDVEVDGWSFKKGERVLLAYSSANRDPDVFDDPDRVILDRFPNKHIGFGAGMHRCVGSFLARIMFEAMINEVLDRIPDYQVVEEELVVYPTIGNINGWVHIPATFTPGTKVGARIE